MVDSTITPYGSVLIRTWDLSLRGEAAYHHAAQHVARNTAGGQEDGWLKKNVTSHFAWSALASDVGLGCHVYMYLHCRRMHL